MATEHDPRQLAARALGDPTRYRIFRYVADAASGVGVAELTEMLGVHHNAIRQHLAVLKEAEVILEEPEARARPGRPRLLYRLNPEVRGTWGTDGPYQVLSSLLAEAVRTGDEPREVGRRAGHRRARRLYVRGDIIGALEDDLRASGFRPERTGDDQRCGFVLGRCPFAEVAAIDPGVVCEMHRGMAEGLVEATGEQAVIELVEKDPRQAGCRLELHPWDMAWSPPLTN